MFVLFIPVLLLLLLALIVILLIKKRWKVAVPFILVVIIVNWWSECVPFRMLPLHEGNNGRNLKVMSFNIDGSSNDFIIKAPRIASLIESYSPDAVFIAEFCEQNVKALDTLLAKIYPYSTVNDKVYFHYFYSKYPLIDAKRLKDGESQKEIDVYSCKIDKNGDTVELYGCHLPSNNYTSELKCFSLDSIDTGSDMLDYMNNISRAYDLRTQQTKVLINDMNGSSTPFIIMGDMNDVGGSVSIKELERGGLQDAWWNGGLGYGATIYKPLPYRIDHILFSKSLGLTKIKVVDSEGLSDHDALYAEFYFLNNKE